MGKMAELSREIENQYDGTEGIDLEKEMSKELSENSMELKLREGCESWAISELRDRLINDERYEDLSISEKNKILKKECEDLNVPSYYKPIVWLGYGRGVK